VKLADAFRIDVADADVTYDLWPGGSRVQGTATLRFAMRPGQTRPLFDFNPLRRSNEPERSMITSLELDGEKLDPYDSRTFTTEGEERIASRSADVLVPEHDVARVVAGLRARRRSNEPAPTWEGGRLCVIGSAPAFLPGSGRPSVPALRYWPTRTR
jgi:hypothetical protein